MKTVQRFWIVGNSDPGVTHGWLSLDSQHEYLQFFHKDRKYKFMLLVVDSCLDEDLL